MATDVIIDPSNGQIYWNDGTGTPQSISLGGNALDQITFTGYSASFSPGTPPGGANTLVKINDSASATLVPGTSGNELGSATLRWAMYGTTSSFSTNSSALGTNSTSLITGTVLVNGGIAISGNASIGQSVLFWTPGGSNYIAFRAPASAGNTTYVLPSSAPVSGATGTSVLSSDTSGILSWVSVPSSGTVSAAVGGGTTTLYLLTANVTSGSGLAVSTNASAYYSTSSQQLTAPFFYSTNSTGSEGGEIVLNKPASGSGLTTTITLDIYQDKLRIFETGGANRGFYLDFSTDSLAGVGKNIISSTSSTGFATTSANVQINSAGSINVFHPVIFTPSVSSAGSAVSANLTLNYNSSTDILYASGILVTSNVSSTSTTTGALQVQGGLGVTGQINAASLITTGNAIINGNLQFKGVGTFGDATSDTITSLARYASDLLPSIDNSYDLGNNALGWRFFKVTGIGTIGTAYVTNTTATTSTTTGALVVSGGVGVGSSIIIGGSVGVGTNLLTSTVNITGSANILGSTVITAPDISTKALRVLGFSSSTQGDIFSLEHPAGGSFTMNGNFAGQAGGRFTIIASGNSQVRGSTFVIQASDTKVVMGVDATSGAGNVYLSNGTNIQLYNSTNAQYAGFKYTGAATTTYTLPASAPGAGVSVLQSDVAGVMSWVPAATGGGSPGGSNTWIQYNNSGAFGATSQFTWIPGIGLSIGLSTASGATSGGSLTVAGSTGIGGSLIVAGQAQFGGTLDFASPNTVAFFVGNVNSYSQILNHNHNPGASASSDYIVSNDLSTDTSTYGDFGINSSGWAATTSPFNTANATYLISNNSDLVLGTVTSNPIRFAVGSGVSDLMHITGSGTAISVFTNFDIRSGNDIRFFNTSNSAYSAIQAGSVAANYMLTLPTALPATGTSVMVSDSSGNMAFAPVTGVGISVLTGATGITISHVEPFMVYFCAGYTPTSTGADSFVFTAPWSTTDGTTSITYNIRRVQMRVETSSSGTSTIKLEKYAFSGGTGISAFSTSSTGSTANILAQQLNIAGAAIAETFVTSASIGFSTGFATAVSGDKFRVNFTALNATHANFSIFMLMDSIS